MNEYLLIISDLFLPLLQLLIIQKCMTAFLGSGNKGFAGYIGWTVYYIFLVISNLGIIFSSSFLLLGNIMLVFIISSVTKRKRVKQRCIFSFAICTIWMLVEVIIGVILGALGIEMSILQNVGSFVSKMCMLLFSAIIKRYLDKKQFSEISVRSFLTILLIPVSSIYLMHQIYLIAAKYEEYNRFSIITSILLLLVNYVIFEVYDWMSRDAELKSQNRLYQQQLDLCNNQAEERESLYLEIRRIRHDMKNHLTGLFGMIHAGESDAAEAYIQKMLDDGIGDRIGEVSRSGNIVIDSLINHKYELAQKNQIQFDANVFVPSSLPFQSGHLVIILGNLLENALEACGKLPSGQRYIKLEVSYVKKMLQICICNSCLPKHRKDATGKYLTTKKNNREHGIGLTSVEQAVSCYHGEAMITETGNKFTVTVVMYANDGEK